MFYFIPKYQCRPYINPLKMLITEIHEGLLYFFINDADDNDGVNLIQYRGPVGVFNNRRFSSSSLNYSCFSKKYHNDDTLTLAVGLIIPAFWHLINV